MHADREGQRNRDGLRQPWVGIRLTGSACQAVGTHKVLDLVQDLGALGALKVSRLDLALDDFDKTVTARMFAEACVAGRLDDETALLAPGLVTRVRGDSWEWSRRKGGCFWLGAPKSARRLRVYDKHLESGGRVPATRIELQCRDEYAMAVMVGLHCVRRDGRPIAEVFGEHVVEFVDLRVPQGGRSRCNEWPRVDWWEKIIGSMKGVAVPGPDSSSARFWVESMSRQSSGFITVMLRSSGIDAKTYALGLLDPKAAFRVVATVRKIVGETMPELTGDQEVRLDQLMRENARRFGVLG